MKKEPTKNSNQNIKCCIIPQGDGLYISLIDIPGETELRFAYDLTMSSAIKLAYDTYVNRN